MKKKYKIKWFNLFLFIMMIASYILIIHDLVIFVRIFWGQSVMFTWLGLTTNILAWITGINTAIFLFDIEEEK